MSAKLLCLAIEQRVSVTFKHKGQRYKANPCSVGYEPRDERGNSPLILRAWCDGGWKDFQVKFMSDVALDGQPFTSTDRCAALWHLLCDLWGRSSEPKEQLH